MGEFLHAIERDRYSPAEVIQAACNTITAAIDETADKEEAIQATQRWIKTSLERAWAVDLGEQDNPQVRQNPKLGK